MDTPDAREGSGLGFELGYLQRDAWREHATGKYLVRGVLYRGAEPLGAIDVSTRVDLLVDDAYFEMRADVERTLREARGQGQLTDLSGIVGYAVPSAQSEGRRAGWIALVELYRMHDPFPGNLVRKNGTLLRDGPVHDPHE